MHSGRYDCNTNRKTLNKERKMLTLEEIKKRLAESNLKAVAEKAGVHYNSLYRLAKADANPSYDTVKKLSDYLERLE